MLDESPNQDFIVPKADFKRPTAIRAECGLLRYRDQLQCSVYSMSNGFSFPFVESCCRVYETARARYSASVSKQALRDGV